MGEEVIEFIAGFAGGFFCAATMMIVCFSLFAKSELVKLTDAELVDRLMKYAIDEDKDFSTFESRQGKVIIGKWASTQTR